MGAAVLILSLGVGQSRCGFPLGNTNWNVAGNLWRYNAPKYETKSTIVPQNGIIAVQYQATNTKSTKLLTESKRTGKSRQSPIY